MTNTSRSLTALYQALILEHSKHPRNHGPLPTCSHEASAVNPLCGDRVTLQLLVDEASATITAAGFQARGCAIARASASLLTEHIKGRQLDDARERAKRVRALLRGERAPGPEDSALAPLLGVRAFPSRLRCATLAWETLEDALTPDTT
jgi:nitrogen fixation NifU-like protein